MSISVTCSNKRDDGSRCGAAFSVDEKFAGEMIPCETCGKLVEAPRVDAAGDDPFFDKQSADDAGPAKPTYDPLADPPPKPEFNLEEQVEAGFDTAPTGPTPPPPVDDDDLFGELPEGDDLPTSQEKASFDDLFNVEPSFQTGSSTVSSDPAKSPETSEPDVVEAEPVEGDRDFSDALPQSQGPTLDFTPGRPQASHEGPTKGCDNCGAEMPAHEVACSKCGWHQTLKQKFEGFIDTGEEPVTGFSLWWRENYIDGGSTRGLAILFIGGGAFLFFMCFACLYTGWGWYACLLFCPLIAVTALVSPFVVGYAQGETAPLHPWNVMLYVLRTTNWPSPNWPFAKVKAFSRRDEPFTTDDFKDVPDLTEIQALDLEGTNLTDEALQVLVHMPQLQYLVLRNTKLSPRTIKSIRTVLARTWVWS